MSRSDFYQFGICRNFCGTVAADFFMGQLFDNDICLFTCCRHRFVSNQRSCFLACLQHCCFGNVQFRIFCVNFDLTCQQVEDEFQVMVRPKYYRSLNRRVSKLTGIKESRLKAEGIPFAEAIYVTDPVTEIQAAGTKPRPTWHPTGSFRWPCSGVITDYFGYREAPTAGASSYHNAIDIGNRTGTPIYAADGGIVTFAGWQSGYGYLIKIDHNSNGFVTYYAHCSALYVSVGDKVYKGEHIAAMGSTGISTGSHLHFGILKNGTWVNPMNYLP